MPAGAATNTWPDISGIYWTNSYSAKITTRRRRRSTLHAGRNGRLSQRTWRRWKTYSLDDKARKLCTPDGVPRILESPYPFEIVQRSRSRRGVISSIGSTTCIRLVTMTKPLRVAG